MVLLIPVIALIIGEGCRRDPKPDVVIKQEDMIRILADLYLADGLLNNHSIRREFLKTDSIENYMRVIEKHGYSMSEFDSNLEYYFKARPKQYEEIYGTVLAIFSEMQAKNTDTRGKEDPSNKNLWNGSVSYRMPDDGTANPIEFSIPTEGTGTYLVRARLTLFNDDQSIDPRSTIYFWYDDGTEEGYKDLWDTVFYEKGSRAQSLDLEKNLNDTSVTHIKGRLIDFTPQPGHWEMHSSVSGIRISRTPFEEGDTISFSSR